MREVEVPEDIKNEVQVFNNIVQEQTVKMKNAKRKIEMAKLQRWNVIEEKMPELSTESCGYNDSKKVIEVMEEGDNNNPLKKLFDRLGGGGPGGMIGPFEL